MAPALLGICRQLCCILAEKVLNDVVHTDAPLSAKAALTINEMRDLAGAAGLNDAVLQRRWPCRFLLTWRRLASSDSGIRTKERSE